jgi:HEAT repeats
VRRSIFAAVLLPTFYITPSSACDCVGPRHEWAIHASRATFAAEVLAQEEYAKPAIDRRYKIRVLAVWRGDLPETTTVDVGSGCGYPLEVGRRYLIYMLGRDAERLLVELCSGTGPLEYLYYDRYLLDEPATRYEPSFETVTLEAMLDLVAQEGSEALEMAWQFSNFQYEAALLLPRLLRIANRSLPGNRLAALRAIGSLGKSAGSAYPHLAGSTVWWSEDDPSINAERILAMAKISGDFTRMKDSLIRALGDEDPVVRRAAVRSFSSFRNASEDREISRVLRRCLDDDDAGVRIAAISMLRFEHDPTVACRVKKLLRSDPDPTVRSEARDYLGWDYRWSRMARQGGSVRDRGFEYRRDSR